MTKDKRIAYLSNEGCYILFRFAGRTIKFKGPYSLEYIASVSEWDDGYIVIMAKYTHSEELIEDYIDLKPILRNLYMDPEEFLKPIEGVEVA